MNAPKDALAEPAVAQARTEMFTSFCKLLDEHNIEYAILSGYEEYPYRFGSDIDFMVNEANFARLSELLAAPDAISNSTLVQALQHQATSCYFAFVQQVGAQCAFLHPDAASDYRLKSRLWLTHERVLSSRRLSPQGFWVSAADVEFEYYLIKRLVDKAHLNEGHVARLQRCWEEDPNNCAAVLERLLPGGNGLGVRAALARGDAAWFQQHMQALRMQLVRGPAMESSAARLRNAAKELARWIARVWLPTGMVMVVLGPDGSGKTTVIEHLMEQLAPAFRRVRRFHLRPRFGKVGGAFTPVTTPHDQAPRGYAASLAKACLFLVDFRVSWWKVIVSARARSTLVVFDRYYHDMLVDPRRYRLPLNFAPVRWLAGGVPRPDWWMILAARPEQLLARKNELSPQAAVQLTADYRALASVLPKADLLDTSGSLEATLTAANAMAIDVLHRRCMARLGLRAR